MPRLLNVVLCSSIAVLGSVAQAHPWKIGGLGPHRWPDGTTITVYIIPDPTDQKREEEVEEGIALLNDVQVLKDKKISIQFKPGVKPPDAKNAVQVQWKPGPTEAGNESSVGKASPAATNSKTTGGTITLRSDKDKLEKGDTPVHALHEMMHIFGVDHDTKTERDVMNVPAKVARLSPEGSLTELSAIYNAGEAKLDIKPSVDPLNDGRFRYRYDVQWLSGTALALFDISIGNAIISDWVAPAGWTVAAGQLPSDLQTDMIDGAAWPKVLSFVLADTTMHLGQENPFMQFSFVANQRPGVRQIWLNDH